MNKEQIEIEIRRMERKLSNVREQIRKQKNTIEDNEYKLDKLKRSLDKTMDNYRIFDRTNESFENLSELRFIKTWVEARKEKNASDKRKATAKMDESYREQKKVVNASYQKLDDLEETKARYERELKRLKRMFNEMP
ncbi:MAG: V-type ATPase 116kDa subunit family protein [Ruminococcaceae bacterium]|nr:V-type ATPase 116kDa subunit family protein [Oscillospiraceae bacterium]